MKERSIIKPVIVFVATAGLLGGLGAYVVSENNSSPFLEIYIFDLSSGYSVFIKTPEDRKILINGGANSEIIRYISEILPFYSRHIDAVISTDALAKNTVGLIEVLERYKVDKAYLPAFTLEELKISTTTDRVYQTFLDYLEKEKVTVDKLEKGRRINLDTKTTIEVLFPAEPENFAYSKSSYPEILMTLSYGKNSILFLGNASNKVQKYIASTTDTLKTDVLIVNNSALPANISKLLIEKIQPKYLVFSKKPVTSSKTVSESTSSTTKKKIIPDPLADISSQNRFNIKEGGAVKITSDGNNLNINYLKN